MDKIDLTARNKDYSIYIPSVQIGSAANLAMKAEDWQAAPLPKGLEPRDFNFLRSDNRYWTYKYGLASAENFRGKKRNTVAHRNGSEFILGDSGGFQIGTGASPTVKKWIGLSEAAVAEKWRTSGMPSEITQWCELNCDYAMTIDIPLWVNREGNEGNSPFAGCETDTLLKLSIENLQYLTDVRGRWTQDKHRCKYLNVLQGETIEEEEELWFNAVKGFKLDGWSLAGKVGVNGGPYRILRRLLLLADAGLLGEGYDWVHLLMLGKLRWAPVVTAIQYALRKHCNEKFTISYDSSSAYMSAGKFEVYYSSRPLTDDIRTWSHKNDKCPTTWGYANSPNPMRLDRTACKGPKKCVRCANGEPHLKYPFSSPIAQQLTLQDLFVRTEGKAKRRVGKLFEEVAINNNVYVIVEGMIRANEAVFGDTPHAPQIIIDACGVVSDIIGKENWHDQLLKHLPILEQAVGHSD